MLAPQEVIFFSRGNQEVLIFFCQVGQNEKPILWSAWKQKKLTFEISFGVQKGELIFIKNCILMPLYVVFYGYNRKGLGNKPPDKSYPEKSHPEICHPNIKPPGNRPRGNKPPQKKASRKLAIPHKPPGKKATWYLGARQNAKCKQASRSKNQPVKKPPVQKVTQIKSLMNPESSRQTVYFSCNITNMTRI